MPPLDCLSARNFLTRNFLTRNFLTKNVEANRCGVPLKGREVAGFVKRRKKLSNGIGCGCYRTGMFLRHRTFLDVLCLALLPFSIRG